MENPLTNDFDKLSLLSEGTPREQIFGYSLNAASPQKMYEEIPKYVRTSERSQLPPIAGNLLAADILESSTICSVAVSRLSALGRGRGKILCMPQGHRSELDGQLESHLRLATPLGYSNELIEQHYAPPQRPQPHPPQPHSTTLNTELAPISPYNVALSSLSRGAQKRTKKISTNSGFVFNDENFPQLK